MKTTNTLALLLILTLSGCQSEEERKADYDNHIKKVRSQVQQMLPGATSLGTSCYLNLDGQRVCTTTAEYKGKLYSVRTLRDTVEVTSLDKP